MKKLKTRIAVPILAAMSLSAMMSMAAFAAEGDVAQIGDKTYATLDAAVEAAEEGATIQLLKDCDLTEGFNKTLTFTGDGKITINKQLTSNGEGWMCFGLYDPTRVLTFSGPDVEVEWNSEVGTAPWLMLSLSGTLNVEDGAKVRFNVDSGLTGSRTAIYMNSGSEINVTDGSTFEIYGNETAGKEGQGIQLDMTGKAEINVTEHSTFVIDGTNRGYVNSPSIYVEDSTFIVRNCTANASNGGRFTAVNSAVTYADNAGHGLSVGDLTLESSTLTAQDNGYYGISVSSGFNVDGTSKVIVTGNSEGGDFAGLKLTSGVTDGHVASGAEVSITNNYCSGLSNNGTCVFEEGAKLTIKDNVNEKGTSSNGGGIYNSGAAANLTLPSDAIIYNNHAKTAGDDIFNNTTATITFGSVGSSWFLDGKDCNGEEHLIDGWYDDSANARWEAHAETEEGNHIQLTEAGTKTGLTALKAAHGTTVQDKTSYPGLEKTVSTEGEEEWSESGSSAVGDMIQFKLESNVPQDLLNYISPDEAEDPVIATPSNAAIMAELEDRGTYNLIFHDQMNEAFGMPENLKVTIDREGEDHDVVLTENQYQVKTDGLEDDCTFEITIDLAALYESGVITADDLEGTPIIVTYETSLKDGTAAGAYVNKAWVSYPEDESAEDTAQVETYGINIFKYDQADPEKGLAGAEFELYQKNEEGEVIEGTVVSLISGADGYVKVDGLDAGVYFLKETKAPEGYVCSDKEIEINTLEKAGVDYLVQIRFANSNVPHTGGSGTRMFTIGGGAIIAAAGILLVVSRKKKDEK